jgi:TolB protein
MRRTALMRLVPVLGVLLFVLGGVAACGGGVAAEKKSTPVSPIASEPGWLAYQYQTDPDDVFSIKVHLTRVDGSHDHAIATNLPGSIRHPDFSPDGSRLAFDHLTSEVSTGQVYVARADGSNAKRLSLPCKVPHCLDYWQAAWSPDGTRLAVSTDAGPLSETGPARFGIAIVDVDSEEVTQVVDHKSTVGQDSFARWSPDGKKLVFERFTEPSDPQNGQAAVFIVNVDGSGLHQLTPWDMLAGDPDWSPKGDLIVFSTHPLREYPSGRSELYTMRPDGSGIKALTSNGENGPRATEPRWTPDGKAILYSRVTPEGTHRSIWAIDHTGRKDGPVLTKKPDYYTHPDLQPVSQ